MLFARGGRFRRAFYCYGLEWSFIVSLEVDVRGFPLDGRGVIIRMISFVLHPLWQNFVDQDTMWIDVK